MNQSTADIFNLIILRQSQMLILQQSGIQSEKFVNINKVHHLFPEKLKSIGFSTTLLHNHPHVPLDHFLVYKHNFTKAEYLPLSKILNNYFPCSWYLEGSQIIAYQFSDQELQFDIQEVQQNLRILAAANYQNYGTTVRPIYNCMELETQVGHVYIPKEQWKPSEGGFVSETATNGKTVGYCSVECSSGFCGMHTKVHAEYD